MGMVLAKTTNNLNNFANFHCTGVELSSKTRKLEWGTDDTDDDIDVEKTLELRQVRACSCKHSFYLDGCRSIK